MGGRRDTSTESSHRNTRLLKHKCTRESQPWDRIQHAKLGLRWLSSIPYFTGLAGPSFCALVVFRKPLFSGGLDTRGPKEAHYAHGKGLFSSLRSAATTCAASCECGLPPEASFSHVAARGSPVRARGVSSLRTRSRTIFDPAAIWAKGSCSRVDSTWTGCVAC